MKRAQLNALETTEDAPHFFEEPDHQVPEQPVITEIDALHKLLVEDAQERSSAFPRQSDRLERIANVATLVTLSCFSLFFVELLGPWVRLLFAMAGLISVGVSFSAMTIFRKRDWQGRQIYVMQELSDGAHRERELVRKLLRFSRAALLHVAATARARDQLIGQRINWFLGPNRAGGILGALFLTLGVFSAGKYLQDTKTVLPILGIEITSGLLLNVALFLFSFAVALLFAGARVSHLNTTAELLERVAALKKHLVEEKSP